MPFEDINRFAIALRHYGRVKAFSSGRSLHSCLFKLGFLKDVFTANNLISMYVDFSFLDDAQRVFEEMSTRNVISWTAMVSGYASCGRPVEAIGLYNRMLESESEAPNGFMYSAVLKSCGLVGDLELGKLIHERISREELRYDTVLMNSLLDMYVKCGNLRNCRKVFDMIPNKSSTSWNTIISGYCKEGLMKEAVNLFYQMPKRNVVSWNSIIAGFTDNQSVHALRFAQVMHQEGLKFDGFTCPCVLKSCGFHGFLASGKQVHCYVIKSGFEFDSFVVSALIDMYSDCCVLNDAKMLFDQYSSYHSSVCSSLAPWNSMLSGYVINGQNGAAINLISQIHSSGVNMDTYTFSSAIKLCINLSNWRLGLQVQSLVVTGGYELDYVIGSILIDLYARLGNIDDALKLFYKLPRKDTVAWSGLITGCAQMGLNSLALSLFRDMVYLNLEVDQFILSTVFRVCSSSASLGSGKQVHAFCVKSGYESEGVTATSLIDMYSKCGEIVDGLVLFDSLLERDTVCWTGIIVGCGQNGRAKEAIKYFHEMIQMGFKPNEVTFLGVLSACRHAGLVEEARAIFRSMKSEYRMEPHVEHYYCIVDLLGQTGCFEEAEDLIADMHMEPDKTIWGSLLGACGSHKKTELVRHYAKQLVKTSPNDPSVYIMLSNTYATMGLWDELCKVRESVKEVGMKEAGKSWIETAS